MPKSLPPRPSLEHLRNQAKALLKVHKRGDPRCCDALRLLHRFQGAPDQEIIDSRVSLAEVQFTLALDYGFESWNDLKTYVKSQERMMNAGNDLTNLAATEVPPPFDHRYDPNNLPAELDAFQTERVLSVCPAGSRIVGVTSAMPHYRYPLCVRVGTPDGGEQSMELRVARQAAGIEIEAKLLPVLARLGLPVPEVLAEPAVDPNHPEAGPMLLTSHLPGEFLPFIGATPPQLDLTCRLLLEGVKRIRQLTDAVQQDPVSNSLPQRTMAADLEGIRRRGGPWMKDQVFADAVERLTPIVERIDTPLVLSNGNNITFNFLCDGRDLTGFVAFNAACFEDPHVQFAKYKIWQSDTVGWGPFNQAGLVERYLYEHNVSKAEFAPRLALRSLWRLQREVSAAGGKDAEYREAILAVLRQSLADLG